MSSGGQTVEIDGVAVTLPEDVRIFVATNAEPSEHFYNCNQNSTHKKKGYDAMIERF